MTTNWKDIIHQIVLWSYPFKDVVRINGSDIQLSGTPMFPSCQSFDISKYWPFESPNSQITIKFNPMNDLMIWLEIEDRRKALEKRKLRSSSLAYEGSRISLKELKPAKYNKYFATISQQHALESYSECKNYPTNGFKNYRECDEDFVYKEMKDNYKFMPFWAAKTLDEVTQFM